MNEEIEESLQPVVSLAQSRRRWFRCISFTESLLIVLAVAVAVVLADIWVVLNSSVRWLAWICLSGGAIIWWIRAFVGTRARYTPREAALSMESAVPEIGQQVRTSLDIAGQVDGGREDRFGFRRRLIAETGARLREFDWRNLIPRQKALRWMLLAVSAVCLIALVSTISSEFRMGVERLLFPQSGATYTRVTWEEVPEWFDQSVPVSVSVRVSGRMRDPALFVRMENGEWQEINLAEGEDSVWENALSGYQSDIEIYAAAGDGRTDTRVIRYEPLPELLEVKTTLRFPDYLEKRDEERPGGDVSTVEGTEVQWTFVFNTEPETVSWSIPHQGKVEELDIGAEKKTASLVVEEGLTYPSLSITDRLGRPVEGWRFRVEGLKDELPEVEILEPAEDRGATRVTEVPVRIRVKDDHGLSEIGVILETNGEKKWLLERVVEGKNERQINDMVVAMLEEVQLELFDNVRIYAYALDRKPRGGPRGLSPIRAIDILQFERRWKDGGMCSGGEGELIKKLGAIIKEQREVVSTLFVVSADTFGTLAAGLVATCTEQGEKEAGLGEDTDKLVEVMARCACASEEDLDSLRIAAEQMREASGILSVPDAAEGLAAADAALGNLLSLRRKMLFGICKGNNNSCEIPPTEKLPRPLSALAEEFRQLAIEEADVRGQIEAGDGKHTATDPKVLKRQQAVAVAKAGELYAELISHPQKSVGALTLADEAEVSMVNAETDLLSDAFGQAVPDLEIAETRLLELADFLEILEQQNLSKAVEEVAKKLVQVAKEVEPNYTKRSGTGNGESSDLPAPESEGESESEETAGESEAEVVESAAGKGKGQSEANAEMAAEGMEGQSSGSEAPDGEGEESESGSENKSGGEGETGIAQSGKGEQAGEKGESEDGGKDGESGGAGEDGLAAKEGERGTSGEKMELGMEKGAGGKGENGKGGREGTSGLAGNSGEKGPGKASNTGDKNGKGADSGKATEDDLAGSPEAGKDDSKGDRSSNSGKGDQDSGPPEPGEESTAREPQEMLAEASRSVRLADQILGALAARGQAESGNAESERRAENGKPGRRSDGEAVGKLRDALELDRVAENLLQQASRAGERGETGETSGESKAGDHPATPTGRPGTETAQLAQEIFEASEKLHDLAVDIAANRSTQLAEVKADLKEMRQESLENPGNGQNGKQIGGSEDKEQDTEIEPGEGVSLTTFLSKVERLNDAQMGAWGRQMADATNQRKRLSLISKMGARLDELEKELPQQTDVRSGDQGVPETSRRDVEDYFRDLSDDFGEETWSDRK